MGATTRASWGQECAARHFHACPCPALLPIHSNKACLDSTYFRLCILTAELTEYYPVEGSVVNIFVASE